MRLYVPGTVLQEGTNELVLLEMDSVPSDLTGANFYSVANRSRMNIFVVAYTVQLVDQPDFYGPAAASVEMA